MGACSRHRERAARGGRVMRGHRRLASSAALLVVLSLAAVGAAAARAVLHETLAGDAHEASDASAAAEGGGAHQKAAATGVPVNDGAAKPRAVLWHYWLSDATLAGRSKCRMDRTRPCMYPCSCLGKLCFKTCTSYCHQLCNDEADDASAASAVNATGSVGYPAEAMGAGEVAVLAVALVFITSVVVVGALLVRVHAAAGEAVPVGWSREQMVRGSELYDGWPEGSHALRKHLTSRGQLCDGWRAESHAYGRTPPCPNFDNFDV